MPENRKQVVRRAPQHEAVGQLQQDTVTDDRRHLFVPY
jgi:hypothetical protein